VTVTNSSSSTVGTGSATVGTYSAISANAGGKLVAASVASATYQQVELDVTYTYGSVSSGDQFALEPAGNPSTVSSTDFNAGCFRLVGAKVLSSDINAIPVNSTAIFYTATAKQASGSTFTVDMAYYFQPECVGIATTAFPYSIETSGSTNVKYSGNYGVTISVPATVANTTTAVTSSLNPSIFGQSVTFTATMTRTPNSGTAGGTVTFVADAGTGSELTLCSAVLVAAGSATCNTALLTPGTHTITANYSGDTNDASSSASLLGGQTVNQAATTTSVTSSSVANTSSSGESVTFTASIAPVSPGAGTPSGTVTFYDGDPSSGGTQIGTAQTLAGGQASVLTSNLSVGDHTIYAVYGGDTDFTGSQGTVGQTVTQASTTTTVTSSSPSNTSSFGDSVTFTASIAPVAPGSGTPSGTVTFYDGDPTSGGTQIGTAQTLVAGQASVVTSDLSLGAHTIYAVYGGDTNFTGSQGTVGQTVSTPTLARIVSFAAHQTGAVVHFHWKVAASSDIAGFTISAGSRLLTTHAIPVHAGHKYQLAISYRGTRHFILHVLLTDGHGLSATAR
jgi:hypothetical protein